MGAERDDEGSQCPNLSNPCQAGANWEISGLSSPTRQFICNPLIMRLSRTFTENKLTATRMDSFRNSEKKR